MAILNQDFEMFAGESKTLQVTVIDDLGEPKDLTNASIKWALCKVGQTIIEKVTPIQIVVTNALLGIFVIYLDAIDTEQLGNGFYQHQAEVTDQDGAIAIVFSGTVTIHNSLFN